MKKRTERKALLVNDGTKDKKNLLFFIFNFFLKLF